MADLIRHHLPCGQNEPDGTRVRNNRLLCDGYHKKIIFFVTAITRIHWPKEYQHRGA
jgi:hypothetical protein